MANDHSHMNGLLTQVDASSEAKRQFYRDIGVAAVAAALELDMAPATDDHGQGATSNHSPAFVVSEHLAA